MRANQIRSDTCVINAHGGAATPRRFWRSHTVAMFAAESQKHEFIFIASHDSARLQPVRRPSLSSTCAKGG